MASMRRQKTDISDAHELAKSHFKAERYETYVQDEYFEQMRASDATMKISRKRFVITTIDYMLSYS